MVSTLLLGGGLLVAAYLLLVVVGGSGNSNQQQSGGGLLSEIAQALPIPATEYRVRERLRVLSQAEYVAPLTDDYEQYELTTWGRGYLHGRVRADLLVPAPNPRRPGYVLG